MSRYEVFLRENSYKSAWPQRGNVARLDLRGNPAEALRGIAATGCPQIFVERTFHSRRTLMLMMKTKLGRPCSELARAALLLTLLTPGLSAAQTEASDTSSPDEAADAPAADVVVTEKARSHFRAGVNLLQDPDGARYEEAYAQFRAAYEESPSWKILGNLAIAAMKLEKDGEAIDAFQRYLEEGGDEVTPEERSQYQRDLDTLSASAVTVTVSGSPAGLVLIDERSTNRGGSIRNQYKLPENGSTVLRIRQGYHRITARLKGYEDQVWEFDARAGTEHEHQFELKVPQKKLNQGVAPTDSGADRPVPISVWIGGGTTLALAAGATVTGVLSLGAKNTYDEANGSPSPDDDLEAMQSKVKTLNLVTDVLIGSAVVAGAVTTILYFTRPSSSPESALRLEPIVGPKIAALSLTGQF